MNNQCLFLSSSLIFRSIYYISFSKCPSYHSLKNRMKVTTTARIVIPRKAFTVNPYLSTAIDWTHKISRTNAMGTVGKSLSFMILEKNARVYHKVIFTSLHRFLLKIRAWCSVWSFALSKWHLDSRFFISVICLTSIKVWSIFIEGKHRLNSTGLVFIILCIDYSSCNSTSFKTFFFR